MTEHATPGARVAAPRRIPIPNGPASFPHDCRAHAPAHRIAHALPATRICSSQTSRPGADVTCKQILDLLKGYTALHNGEISSPTTSVSLPAAPTDRGEYGVRGPNRILRGLRTEAPHTCLLDSSPTSTPAHPLQAIAETRHGTRRPLSFAPVPLLAGESTTELPPSCHRGRAGHRFACSFPVVTRLHAARDRNREPANGAGPTDRPSGVGMAGTGKHICATRRRHLLRSRPVVEFRGPHRKSAVSGGAST